MRKREFLLASVVALVLASLAEAGPRLIVLISVDQLRSDYLQAFNPYFEDGGFRRLQREGASFSRAFYLYGTTATAVGNATLITGVPPAEHGIVGNTWYALSGGDLERTYCCGDPSVRLVGDGRGGGRSPRNMKAPALGDRLKQAFGPGVKVWSVSIKDRAAVLTAGHKGDGAVWWDLSTGNWVTSSYYGSALPAWADQMNSERFVDRFFKKRWDRLLPADVYDVRFFDDPGAGALAREYHANQFPKILGSGHDAPNGAFYLALCCSPFGNELVFEGARRLLAEQQLGKDDVIDLLTVGLSSNDFVGHQFGPGSQEVMDCTLRTDRQIASFLRLLDAEVGRAHYVVAVSADHGTGPVTEYTAALGRGGGRLSSRLIKKQLEGYLRSRFNRKQDDPDWVGSVSMPWVYLAEPAIRVAGADVDAVARAAAEGLEQISGVARGFARPDILAPGFADRDPLNALVRNCYYDGRSGHVYMHWQRYWYSVGAAAGHGSAHDYDRHVPILISGPGVNPGEHSDPVRPIGLAPVLATLAGVDDLGGYSDLSLVQQVVSQSTN